MKAMVIGAHGQLGTDVVEVLTRHGDECVPTTRQTLDVCDRSAVEAMLGAERPDAVVNCAAYHDVAGCEENPGLAAAVNTHAVATLASSSNDIGARFMTVSTDYVFDGIKVGGYTEKDIARPLNRYGVSKLEGEGAALAANPRTFVVRTQSLFGHSGARGKGLNFVDLMIKLATERPELQVDQCRMAPTGTAVLAENMRSLLLTDHFGLFHMSCEGETTWYGFAKRILELIGSTTNVTPVSNYFFPRTFVRPENTYLINAELEALGLDQMPHWEQALVDYLREKGYAALEGRVRL